MEPIHVYGLAAEMILFIGLLALIIGPPRSKRRSR